MSERKLRVFEVLGGPEGGWGGAGVVVMAITEALLQQGHEVWVQCLSEEAEKRFGAAGAHVVTSRLWKRAISPWYDLRALVELYRLCRREKFDVVNTHTSKGGIIGRIGARLAGVPVVIHTAHGYAFNETDSRLKAWAYTWIERIAGWFCDLVISVNEEERLDAIAKKVVPAHKIVTIYNGIDLKPLENRKPSPALRRELAGEGIDTLLGFTGRLAEQKGLEYLIRAMPAVLAECPRTRVLLAGEGPLEAELKALAAGLGVADHVTFLGFRADIPDFLACLDVYVLPSLWEGLSISLMEAMAHRLPIVATRIKGNREMIEDGVSGLLVPPADPPALAAAIIRLIRDPELAQRLGEGALQKARHDFDRDKMVSRTLALYAAPHQAGG